MFNRIGNKQSVHCVNSRFPGELALARKFLQQGTIDFTGRFLKEWQDLLQLQRYWKEKNRKQGRYMIHTGVENLNDFFTRNTIAAVLSLNVLDILPLVEWEKTVLRIHQLLKKQGLLLHIMISSVHNAVFQNIALAHPGRIIQPFYGRVLWWCD